MTIKYGITGPNGATGCGDFHEFLPGEDGFCDCCRPPPDHPVIQKAEAWIRLAQDVPPYGGRAWRQALERWQEAGRP